MKIGYSKTFPIIGKDQWEKIWIESDTECSTPEEVKKELYSLKNQVQSFHYESLNSEKKKEQEIVIDEDGKTIVEILLCRDLAELSTYVLQTARSKAIKAAYNNRLKQLQNGLEQY